MDAREVGFFEDNPYAPPRPEPEPPVLVFDEENDILKVEFFAPNMYTGGVYLMLMALYPVVFFMTLMILGGGILVVFIMLIAVGGLLFNVLAFAILLLGFAILYQFLRKLVLLAEQRIYTRIVAPLYSQIPENARTFLVHLSMYPKFKLRNLVNGFFPRTDIGLAFIEDEKLCFLGDNCNFSLPVRALHPNFPCGDSLGFLNEKAFQLHLRKSPKHEFSLLVLIAKGEAKKRHLIENGKEFEVFIRGWLRADPEVSLDY